MSGQVIATRNARQSAMNGLRMIAAMEEYVAGEIDGPGYFGALAGFLKRSADDRRALAGELVSPDGPPEGPRLRLVTANADQEAQ